MPLVPFKVKAVYEYTSPHEDDLHFPNGQIITVVEEEDEDWYAGEYVDADGVKREGIFPRNFVEKFEPIAPPRPVRTARSKKEAETATATAPEHQQIPLPAPAPVAEAAPELETKESGTAELPPAPEQATKAPKPAPISVIASAPKQAEESPISPAVPKAAPAPITAPSAAKSPPPAAEKPTTGSFRDRIAAFNKAAPPPVPYKPGGNGAANFIRKPFVAPPPSKNAYIPPPQSVPVAKIYRRDEDPEIAAREHENQENAEKAGLAPTSNEGEEQPKPTSLKERIALLQKQQAEQAARHADAAAKKEKPKKPAAKKRAEYTTEEGSEDASQLERTETHEAGGGRSIDDSKEELQLPVRRKSTRDPPPPPPRADTDGNEADMSGAADETEGNDTEREDPDPRAKHPERAPPPPRRESDVGDEEDTAETAEAEQEEEEDDDDEDIDPEIRRKEEIRARMMKMSGGMGMMGMFGPPGGMPMPAPSKKKKTVEKQHSQEQEATSPQAHAPPVPVMALPAMSKEEIYKHDEEEDDDNAQAPPPPPHGAPITSAHAPDDVADIEDVAPEPPAHAERPAPPRPSMSQETFNAPPLPGSRAQPPLPPVNTRPIPPPLGPMSPSAGSASDDELSQAGFTAMRTPTGEVPRAAPPSLPHRDERPQSPKKSLDSYFHEPVPVTPTSPRENRRASRIPPPIPGAMPVASPQQSRGPPPLPPGAPSLRRASTADAGPQPLAPRGHPEDTEDAENYEGDYDTDMPSSKDHKDALKSAKEEDDSGPPLFMPSGAPPVPPSGAPRMPPPLPSQPPPPPRQSVDMPRAAPPPPPPAAKEISHQEYDEEYDPYNYSAPKPQHAPPPPPQNIESSYSRGDDGSYGDADDDMYSATPPRSPAPMSRGGPPPPPREMPHVMSPPSRDSASRGRSSMDTRRDGRRSMDMNRLVNEHDFIANDIDLGITTMWWASAAGVPPAFFGRKDILHETEESTAHKRGGKSTTTKDLYVLFPDYSQTIITVHFDPANPVDANFEQKHEAPPAKLRPDQLEESHERYGRRLHDAVSSKKDTVVGDGTPAGLVVELLKPLRDALLPIGTRAYGALVYSNQGNSLTSQFDEIRPGDIVTFRNAKFQGKHGPMHAKYTAELGRGEGHVGIVAEWDGAKKKVRAWEQGRESRKVKVESFKLEDLRSGEVKIWRVMGRNWVGWEGQNS